MKIGITIPNYYCEYLAKIANLNGSNPTKVCSLIVENFLSYNLNLKKFPLFRKDVRIVFAHEKSLESNSDTISYISRASASNEDSELDNGRSWNEIVADLESSVPEDPEDSGLPFDYDSED